MEQVCRGSGGGDDAAVGGVDPTAWGYSFLGDGERGVVRLHRSGDGAVAHLVVGERRVPTEMRVVRDGDRWLLDEW